MIPSAGQASCNIGRHGKDSDNSAYWSLPYGVSDGGVLMRAELGVAGRARGKAKEISPRLAK